MHFNINVFLLINLVVSNCAALNDVSGSCSVNQLYNNEGDLKISLILNDCFDITSVSWTYINSAIWIIERLNALDFTNPLSVGLSIFQICTENDYYNPVYKLFKDRGYILGAISNNHIPDKVREFGDVLGINLIKIDKYQSFLVDATVKLLLALNFTRNITVYSENRDILQEFYKFTRKEYICVKNSYILDKRPSENIAKFKTGPVVIFSGQEAIKALLLNSTFEELDASQIIFALLDGSEFNDFPEGSYVIQHPLSERTLMPRNSSKLIHSPLLFEIANPIINILYNISNFVNENCNETLYKISCLRNKYPTYKNPQNSVSFIVNALKIEAFIDKFVYKIFRVENVSMQNQFFNSTKDEDVYQSFVNVFIYSIFNGTLTNLDYPNLSEVDNREILCPKCRLDCVNFVVKVNPKTILISYAFPRFGLRSESWVFAFLAISSLGIIFCVAIFIFLVARFCKRDILEGNPFLTLLLLLSVILMYCSVIPFTLDSDKETKKYICLAQALSTTLTYAFAFSLLLSRSILLATISKEVGFMSHVPGPVQSFLTLFIFGVQAALSVQFINHCEDIFRGIKFVYLMSYNVILLILLVFICPLNTRMQRNYKEGKHFTVAVVLLAFIWSCWIPGYAVLGKQWKDPILCLGLVSTASALLGAIFIPRTYLMTIAAARDRLTSTLPSLPANSSIMDVYRASNQPVYDCINIAAINARGISPLPPQPEAYSNLEVSYEDDFDFERCITPTPDKVTRF